MEKNRLEAFSDGVLAIIITIMVLELKVPHGAEWGDLLKLWPKFLSYVLSFIYVGIYWGNHHHLMHTVQRVSGGIIWSNMLLLFFLSLVPFATAWMGENHFETNTVVVYAIVLALAGMAFFALQQVIASSQKHDEKLVAAMEKVRIKGIASQLAYLAAIPIALWKPGISLFLFAVVAVVWIVPDRGIEKALKG
ncbi:MAG: DUF1211 domain-containing protein [Saprospiraceae bacterium]|nr:DUF1211 domain-containing protein [Saprospiraceae bacterium]